MTKFDMTEPIRILYPGHLKVGDYIHPPHKGGGVRGVITAIETGGDEDNWYIRLTIEGRESKLRCDPVDLFHISRPREVKT